MSGSVEGHQAEESWILEWIQSLDLPSKNVESLQDLSDGLALLDVLILFEQDYFFSSLLQRTDVDNMAVKQKNLETLWDSLLEWYMDELKAVNAPEPFDVKLAAEGDAANLIKLAKVVLSTVAVSHNQEKMVKHVMGVLSKATQTQIVLLLKEAMETTYQFQRHQEENVEDQHGESEEESPGHDYFVATPIKHVDHTVAALERAASTSKSIGELEAQVEELLGKVDQVQSEKAELQTQLQRMTQHQEQLERDVRKLKDEVQSKDFDLQEMGQLREDMKTLQAEKEKLLSEQAKSQEISAENAHLLGRLAEAEATFEDLRKQASKSSDFAAQLKAAKENITITKNKKNKEIADLKEQLSAAKRLEEEYEAVVRQNTSYEDEIAVLKRQLQTVATNSSMQEELEALRSQVEEVSARERLAMEQKEKLTRNVEALEKQLRDEQSSRTRVRGSSSRNELSTLSSELEEGSSAASSKAAEDEMRKLRIQCEQRRDDLLTTRQLLEERDREVEGLRKSLEASSRVSSAEQESIQGENARLRSQIETLQAALENARSDLERRPAVDPEQVLVEREALETGVRLQERLQEQVDSLSRRLAEAQAEATQRRSAASRREDEARATMFALHDVIWRLLEERNTLRPSLHREGRTPVSKLRAQLSDL